MRGIPMELAHILQTLFTGSCSEFRSYQIWDKDCGVAFCIDRNGKTAENAVY